jgi:8-oxo-dGTP diphosphatase
VILLFASTEWKGIPQAHAATDLAWCDPVDLQTWAMPPLDYPLAQALSKMLASGAI